ncbi:MAG: hypothetical protein IPL32_13050 [Chloracidobacterium sp.]|nr:hypothetical protein [Chloracidobacterium sp.]
MKVNLRHITYFTLIALAFTFSTTAQAQNRAYRATDRQVQTLLDRIESRTNEFKTAVDRTLDRSNIDGTRQEDSINQIVANFETATDNLKNNFSSRRSSSNDVQQVLDRAAFLNSFMRNNRMSQNSQNLWSQIRTDLNTLSGYYQVRYTWNDAVTPTTYQGSYTVSVTQMRNLLNRLKQRSTSFQQSFNSWNNRYNRNGQMGSAANVPQNISEFNRALNDLSRNFNDRNRNAGIDQVMRPSASINSFMSSNRTNNDVTNKWNLVRGDLNTLANYYRVSWDWNNPIYPNDPYGNNGNSGNNGNYGNNGYSDFDSRLTGTYRLNSAQSDNVQDAVARAISNANIDTNQRERSRRGLERRLTSPETLTFEKRGQQVTMSSANAQSVTLNADGVSQTETSPNGRTVTTNVTATNRDLTINYEGDRMNDYYVSFTPMNNGQLKVTRRVYIENQNTTVTVASVYDKTSQTPEWNTTGYPTNNGGNQSNRFLIPNNTAIVATLDSSISTKTTRDNDRFSMTVTSPSQYNGAVIEGTVNGEGSGVVSGRANMTLSFDTIRTRDGRTYAFAGIVDQVRDTNGNTITVNNEGTVQDKSQTTTTVVRSGIGAALGAIIGAIAGGGKGAAIGAVVGGGAGAGTVVLQGRDNLELNSGSQFSITATGPSNVGVR